ncbi:MAG: thymidine phosphorylase [Clostridia bacterium]|jgi:pyrimidine-nucleoside phosphorylase|nr:thymidine phosphorylase [Clostridia bacterium]
MDIKTIIQKKRKKGELNRDEIRYFVGKFTRGEIEESQAAALMSYIYINGLTEDEIVNLSLAMAESGDKIDLSGISENIVDKHSTGGVGDKVTIILLPVIAALGIPVAKISSRGYGVTGGTIDKLEAIPGYDPEISIEEFKELVKNNGISIINQTLNLAPAEGKMYKLRNQIACTDSLPIIAASLMSLKLATGSTKIVFDICCGNGTYIKTREDARRLAKLLVRLGKRLDKKVACTITSMDEPLGYSIGNILEMQEVINSLQGRMPEDLGEVVVTLGGLILNIVTENKNREENEQKIKEVLRNGQAFEKFKTMISSQYGSLEYVEHPEKLKSAKYIMPVYAIDSGTIERIDADIVGSIARYLGAGRMNNEKEINNTAGIVLNKKIGDNVTSGEIVAYIHTDDESKISGATQNLQDAFKLTNKKIPIKPRVLDIIV